MLRDAATASPDADGGDVAHEQLVRESDGASVTDEDAAPPPPIDGGEGVCTQAPTVGAPTLVASASSGGADDLFGAITPDELTIAWMSVTAPDYKIYYADRDSPSEPFLAAKPLVASGDYYANDRIAMSPDGLRIVFVRSDRKGLGEFVRTVRKNPFFEEPTDAAFAGINGLGAMLPANEYLGDPVVAPDDLTFFFSRYGGGITHTVYESRRNGPVTWPLGTPHPESSLSVVDGQRRYPTGISSDLRTLFYFDEPTGKEHMAVRATVADDFDRFIGLGAQSGAQPNLACNVLYFSDQMGGSLRNFTAPLQ
jgi:hypothetical protein